MGEIDYDICSTQKEIYEYMVDSGYDLKAFSNAYLLRDFCRSAMDTIYSRFQIEFPDELREHQELERKYWGKRVSQECL
ncbi:MAG: hypothetical protein HDR02_17705 [Lachnospiraceae bacterium]|nr:hypothetical protein [Lachnospiraceae bacterium]